MEHTHLVSVAALVTNDEGKILLVKSPWRGWEYPGGLIEPGESFEAALKREIFMEICDWIRTGTARKVEDLMKAVKMMAFADEIPLHQDRIHVANGTWYFDGHFSEEKEYCRNRLEVAYNSAAGIANVWLNFLSELLIPGDIPTLQEYLGYCLLPTTKAQKMLLLIGKGGE